MCESSTLEEQNKVGFRQKLCWREGGASVSAACDFEPHVATHLQREKQEANCSIKKKRKKKHIGQSKCGYSSKREKQEANCLVQKKKRANLTIKIWKAKVIKENKLLAEEIKQNKLGQEN